MPAVGEVPPYVEGDNAALALRQRLDLGDAPLNIWKLIRELDVIVWRHDFGPDAGDGMYIRKGGRSLIIVNSERRASKQRFTAAHELGHHELHRHGQDSFVIGDMDVLSTGKVPAEVAANAFAATLMAPSRAVLTALGDLRGVKISPGEIVALMGRFGLSYEASCWRARNAGAISLAHARRLLEETGVELLVAQAGIDEEADFPPGPELPPEFVANVDKLWRHHAIDDRRHAEMLRARADAAARRRAQEGVERDEMPDIDEAAAAALLDG